MYLRLVIPTFIKYAEKLGYLECASPIYNPKKRKPKGYLKWRSKK